MSTAATIKTSESKSMVFLMGLPASGKSTTAKSIYGSTHQFIDPDLIKESHPDYNPAEAYKIHDWSKVEEEKQWQAALTTDGLFVIDGTGVNAEKMVRRIKQAQALGFETKLMYVTCSLETSIRRALKRVRQVPLEMIREKALNIQTAYEIVSQYVEKIEVIENDIDR